MKKAIYLISIIVAFYLVPACSNSTKNNNHSHEEHSHNHEGHNHVQEGNNQNAISNSYVDSNNNKLHYVVGEAIHKHDSMDSGHTHKQDNKYGIVEIVPQEYYEVIHTSGRILPAQGDEHTLTAIHSGIVVFGQKPLLAGSEVSAQEFLLTISGKKLVHDNIETSFINTKTSYETALSNFERAKILNQDKIITDKDFADFKLKYLKTKNSFDNVIRNYSSGGHRVTTSVNGFIKNVLVTEGQYVTTGQALMKIVKNKRLIVKADVPQSFFHKLKEISSANFITAYDKKLYNTNELNGKLISYGRTSLENSLFTPVYFEIDNMEKLLAGSFVEIFLKTTPVVNSIIIPKTALLEEAGRYYVYIENGEEFEKRYVTIDGSDGHNYHIIDGLNEGDHIATNNPYQIKLASMSISLPVHSHSH
ncbi:MAG: efflux RND transporter periplasmic adaptor subunit [Bacteroidota bacterium]|nr:efflux RND transporter periplasmic adaptor subunit [Bacteroidota bacterium]